MTSLLYPLLFVLTVFIGVVAIGLGIWVGLNPFGVFLTTVASSLVYMWIVLAGGSLLIERVFPSLASRMEARVDGSRAQSLVDRWGAPGLAVVGSTVLGPTLSLLSALLLGVDRRRFAWWYAAATLTSFAVFTALWSAILS